MINGYGVIVAVWVFGSARSARKREPMKSCVVEPDVEGMEEAPVLETRLSLTSVQENMEEGGVGEVKSPKNIQFQEADEAEALPLTGKWVRFQGVVGEVRRAKTGRIVHAKSAGADADTGSINISRRAKSRTYRVRRKSRFSVLGNGLREGRSHRRLRASATVFANGDGCEDCDDDEGTTKAVLGRKRAARSASRSRRGRDFFRGIGASFSTSARRKAARSIEGGKRGRSGSSKILLGRVISPSPDRKPAGQGDEVFTHESIALATFMSADPVMLQLRKG